MGHRAAAWLWLGMVACATGAGNRETAMTGLDQQELARRRAQFADVDITVDRGTIPPEDLEVLRPLLKAAAVMDRIFWKQASHDGMEVLQDLRKRTDPLGRLLAEYVEIHRGRFDRLEDHAPFYGTGKKPRGATFYPEDLTVEEFEAWIAAHPEDREDFLSPFTVIRRDGDRLKAIPYSEFYREDLEEAARWLLEAASKTRDPMLARFLRTRAEAFRTNDYFESDMAWMDLHSGPPEVSSALEVVIGPYEVYEDGLMNLKASFEAFVTLRDAAESHKLQAVAGLLDEMEAALPVDDRHKNFSRGKSSPIAVVQVIFTSGDTAAGVQTTAFNLPNDERVRTAKGSKKVLLKNVGEAKFRRSLIPIARTLLDPALQDRISFDAYFNFILMHEVSHGLGPGVLALPGGGTTTVNLALKETYSGIEECKADVLGVLNALFLVRKGLLPREVEAAMGPTYLAGIFRSIRFGVTEAHGIANMIQYNWLREQGVVTWDDRQTLHIDLGRYEDSLRQLARRLLTIQAEGDYEGARRMLDTYGSMPDEVRKALARLSTVPVDIRPRYPLAEALMRE
ncbi:MAG TPA: peptidase [Myxococcota bacterium]|nr:peptidase [Myxococcota bacterium]HQK49837.1 peptidase [Myxococcota bacterium]